MNTKFVVVAVLAPLSFVPAAILAYVNRVQPPVIEPIESRVHHAVAGAGPIVGALASPRIELEPVLIVTPLRTERPVAARGGSAVGCDEWRPLRAGTAARAVSAASVRACNGPPAPSPSTVQERAATVGPTQRDTPTMEFVFDLAAPQR